MTKFEAIFGINAEQVKEFCVLMPFISKGILSRLKIDRLGQGKLYHSGGNDDLTLIRTGMGAGLAADAVLYLQNTPCRKVVLFGSCGAVRETSELTLGTPVTPVQCYGAESFTDFLLQGKIGEKPVAPDQELLRAFLEINRSACVIPAKCLTVASLKLEEERRDLLISQGIEVVDMECSAFFSAAGFAGLQALAFFYISDIINKRPFYADLEPGEKAKLSSSAENAARLLYEFIQNRQIF